MKKETSFLNKLKLDLALSTLFFIISMIPFALANKEEVTDSYKMEFILDLIIPFLLSFIFFLTLLPAEKYIKNGIRFYLKFFCKLVCFKLYYPFRAKIIFHIDKLLSVIL